MKLPVGGATPLIPISAVSIALGLAKSTIYKLVSTGELEHIKIGRTIRFKQQMTDNYIENHTCKNVPMATIPLTQKRVTRVKGGKLWEI